MKIVRDTYSQLFDFQKAGVEFLATRRSALLADQLGVGKTAQAIHACQQVGARSVLVICTASIKYNWKKEAVKWGYDERDVFVVDKRNVSALPETGMFIINYDLIWRKPYATVLSKRAYDVLICDECHALKERKTRRSKAVLLRNGYADLSVYRWMLTATPVLNRPVELYNILAKLCPDRLGQYVNYIAYTKQYCGAYQGNWGWDVTGAINLDELAGRLDGFMLRRTRDTLPDKVLHKIYFPMSDDIKSALFSEGETASIRRRMGIGKLPLAVEHIETVLQSEQKVVVFAYHTDVINGLKTALSAYNPVVVNGAVTGLDRERAVDMFSIDDTVRVFIGQIYAAGEGIDGLQNACNVAVFVEVCHTPGMINQAIGRIYRQGQTKKCVIQFLVIENTVDEQVLDSAVMKEKNIVTILKDKTHGLCFSDVSVPGNPENRKEDEMGIEQSLDRIAACLEETLTFLKHQNEKGVKLYVEQVSELSNEPKSVDLVTDEGTSTVVVDDVPVPSTASKPRSKRPRGRPAGGKTESVGAPVEGYLEYMNRAANAISGFYNDATKTNAVFAELTKRFKQTYPQYATVMDVKPVDQPDVMSFVSEFLNQKGIQ